MASPHHWPEADCIEALRLKASGMTWRQVGEVFGKSKSSAEAACRRHQGQKRSHVYYSADDPPIGLEMSETTWRNNAKRGSAKLRLAIKALMERMPARKVAEVAGAAHAYIPGTEPVMYGQLAERKLAA